MRLKKTALILGIFFLANNARADLATDPAMLLNAVKQLKQLEEQYTLLSDSYENAKAQLNQLKSLSESNSGHYGFGDLDNSLSDLKARQWSANTWDEALNNIAGGNPSRYQELVKAYQNNHITLDDSEYRKGASPERLVQYQQAKTVNQTLSVQSTYAFNEVNAHLKAIHSLASHIEKTPNTKASIDLNSRLLAEIAYIQTETLKLQTLLNQQSAFTGSSDIAADSEVAKFNKLPEE